MEYAVNDRDYILLPWNETVGDRTGDPFLPQLFRQTLSSVNESKPKIVALVEKRTHWIEDGTEIIRYFGRVRLDGALYQDFFSSTEEAKNWADKTLKENGYKILSDNSIGALALI